jgi:sugar/nucleoside kinase (ribokinase family)
MHSAANGVLVVGDLITDTLVSLQQPMHVGSDAAANITDAPGGQGANVAQWLITAGVPLVRLLAAVSIKDSAQHHQRLVGSGIDPALVRVDGPPGRIVVVVDPGGTERSFLTQRGAAAMLSGPDGDSIDLSGIGWCHVSGYLFETLAGRECFQRLAARCEEQQIPVSVDPASVSLIQSIGPDEFLRLVGQVAMLCPNEAEARALTGCQELGDATQALLRFATTAVITMGANGAVAADRNGGAVSSTPQAGSPADPTGAGDAFAAGFIERLMSGATISDALHAATQLATRAISAVGATNSPM